MHLAAGGLSGEIGDKIKMRDEMFQNKHPRLTLGLNVLFIMTLVIVIKKNYEDISHISQGKDISDLTAIKAHNL